jgi:hypothetical protein
VLGRLQELEVHLARIHAEYNALALRDTPALFSATPCLHDLPFLFALSATPRIP